MKKFFTLFASVAMTIGAFAQTSVTFDASAQGWSNGQAITSATIDSNLSMTATKNSSQNAPAYYSADVSLRFYSASGGAGGSMTITPNNGAVITAITINAVSGNAPAVNYYVDGSTTGIQATKSGTVYTISGINASSSLKIQNAASSSGNQFRVTDFTITYSVGSTLATNEVKANKNVFVKNTLVDSEINFGANADIKIYNVNGQIVREAKVSTDKALNVQELNKGTYIVTGTVNGNKVSEKIIKK